MRLYCNIIIDSQKYIENFDDIHISYSSSSFVKLDGKIHNIQILYSQLTQDSKIAIERFIFSLYDKYGPEGLYKLDGDFSLVLYDKDKKITILYRSFLTGYPLYYVVKNNLLSVSSNPIDFFHRPDVSDRLNMEQLSGLFALDSTAWDDTVFEDLNEVEHGEMVKISSQGIVSKKRPLKEVLNPPHYGSEIEIIDTYKDLVESAVARNIFPSKKYGIMLSSGMDSSTLAYFASKQLQEQGTELRAYSWTLPNYKNADETKKIQELCSKLHIELTIIEAENFMPFSNLDNLALQADTPFSNLFSPMIAELYKKACEDGINVLFNGHYGDNLFPSTRGLFIDILDDKRYELFLPTLKSVISQVGYANAIRHSPSIRGLIKYLIPFYKPKKQVFSVPEWLSTEAKKSKKSAWENQKAVIEEGYENFAYALSKFSTSSGVGRYEIDKYGLERIEPFVDVALLNYTLRLPAYMSYRDGQMKYFAREAMRGLLPESIRTQGRVGLLNQFAYDGFMKHKNEVRERLFDERDPWKVYVDEKWMEERFKKGVEIKDKELLVIWMSLHMAPWQKAIKPGGSLYEGTFMQNSNLQRMK